MPVLITSIKTDLDVPEMSCEIIGLLSKLQRDNLVHDYGLLLYESQRGLGVMLDMFLQVAVISYKV